MPGVNRRTFLVGALAGGAAATATAATMGGPFAGQVAGEGTSHRGGRGSCRCPAGQGSDEKRAAVHSGHDLLPPAARRGGQPTPAPSRSGFHLVNPYASNSPGARGLRPNGYAGQKRVGGGAATVGAGSGATSTVAAARTSSWNRRARPRASSLSGVWMNTVGLRPSASQPATTGTHGCQPATVASRSSRPKKRMTGRFPTATVRRGNRGLADHASRSASLVGGRANRVVVSNVVHSAPRSASSPARAQSAGPPSK